MFDKLKISERVKRTTTNNAHYSEYFDDKNKENLTFGNCSSDDNNDYSKNEKYSSQLGMQHERRFSQLPEEDLNINYAQEYKRLFLSNVALLSQIKEMKSGNQKLQQQISNQYDESPNKSELIRQLIEKKKRIRRAAEEIDRHYRCPVQTCEKSYGSEGSLHQHLKLKHPSHYEEYLQTLITQQSQREKVQKKN